MKVCKRNAFIVHPIKIWRLQNRVSVAGKVTIALVIGEQNDNVGAGQFATVEAAQCHTCQQTDADWPVDGSQFQAESGFHRSGNILR